MPRDLSLPNIEEEIKDAETILYFLKGIDPTIMGFRVVRMDEVSPYSWIIITYYQNEESGLIEGEGCQIVKYTGGSKYSLRQEEMTRKITNDPEFELDSIWYNRE